LFFFFIFLYRYHIQNTLTLYIIYSVKYIAVFEGFVITRMLSI